MSSYVSHVNRNSPLRGYIRIGKYTIENSVFYRTNNGMLINMQNWFLFLSTSKIMQVFSYIMINAINYKRCLSCNFCHLHYIIEALHLVTNVVASNEIIIINHQHFNGRYHTSKSKT